jgi:hypothetical protein
LQIDVMWTGHKLKSKVQICDANLQKPVT